MKGSIEENLAVLLTDAAVIKDQIAVASATADGERLVRLKGDGVVCSCGCGCGDEMEECGLSGFLSLGRRQDAITASLLFIVRICTR